jgi:hypothetical protein
MDPMVLRDQIRVLTEQLDKLSAATGSVITNEKTEQVKKVSDHLPNMVSDVELTEEDEVLLDAWLRRISRALSEHKVSKFTGKGWQTWEKIITNDLTPLRLMKALETEQTPASLARLSPLNREKHIIIDMKLTTYLMVRLDPSPQRAVTSCKSAHLMWQKLKKLYASTSVVTQHRLKDQWEQVAQLPGQSVTDYLADLEYLADSLEVALIPQRDSDKLHRLLKGLSSDWDAEKKYFQLQKTPFKEVCTMLLEIGEQRSEELLQRQIVPAYSAREESAPTRGRQVLRGRSEGQPPARQEDRRCYTCGSHKHLRDVCPTGLKPSKGPDGLWITRCFNCLQEGHVSNKCPMPRKSRFGSSHPPSRTAFAAKVEVLPASSYQDEVQAEDEEK